MLVTEKVLGPAEARRVYDFQMNRYLQKRGETGKDVPLLEVDDHPHVAYGKGAVALYTLREHIGAEAVNCVSGYLGSQLRFSFALKTKTEGLTPLAAPPSRRALAQKHGRSLKH